MKKDDAPKTQFVFASFVILYYAPAVSFIFTIGTKFIYYCKMYLFCYYVREPRKPKFMAMRILRSGGIEPKLGGPKSAKIDSRVVLRAATNFCLKTTIENRKLPSGAPRSPRLIDVSCQN
jgi:hypothetical protein